MIFFFFSSRRRHTRWPRDWSSDVCSSDLSLKLTIAEYFIPSGRGIQALNYTQDDTLPVTEKDSRGREVKTRNGRIVTDGKGIEPDRRIESMEPSLLEVALQKRSEEHTNELQSHTQI